MSHRGEPLPVSSEVELFLKKENYDKKMNKFHYLKALKFDKLIHETNEIKINETNNSNLAEAKYVQHLCFALPKF